MERVVVMDKRDKKHYYAGIGMNNKIKDLIIAITAGMVLFNVLPWLFTILPAEMGMFFYVLVLLIVNPIFSFMSSLILTIRNGSIWYFPLVIGLLFLPAIFTVYNESATVYVFIYTAISLIACVAGYFFNKRA